MKMNISLPVEIDIPDCVIAEIRNKAIDDFAEACKQNIMCQTFGLHPRNVDEIAKQLKAGDCD